MTEGDPMLYSTFLQHTCAALRAYPRVETVRTGCVVHHGGGGRGQGAPRSRR
ncbi:MAG: hypothetical protein U0531_05895 [Dehalococcoidia bacterium]